MNQSIARGHPLDKKKLEIWEVAFKQNQSYHPFVTIYSFVSFFEPSDIDEALRDLDWVNAMHEELNNFIRNQVWELVERPQSHNITGTKWVLQNKQNEDEIVTTTILNYLEC